MTTYYNEFDKGAAVWLRELIAAGLIAPGEVDERSIEDVRPSDLRGFTQCHFFAGIGGWSLALRMAGWPDSRPVWTGSCPCQPFSAAGKGAGFSDERHLWPAFHWLIGQCEPPVVFGEQVASADGLVWLDLVQADLEATGYAFGAADLCAAGVGAPHIRQRLYWVADADAGGKGVVRVGSEFVADGEARDARLGLGRGSSNGGVEHAELQHERPTERQSAGSGDVTRASEAVRPAPLHGFWGAADWLGCRDGKWRPVEPSAQPMVDGLPRGLVRGGDQRLAPNNSAEGRVMRLRGYGNAIVPQVAVAFISAAMG